MSETTQGFSQFLFTYGPGAMFDLPDHAVIMAGLDDWPRKEQELRTIEENRLAQLLLTALPERFSAHPQFLTPPLHDQNSPDTSKAVPVRIFPEWFVADSASSSTDDGDQTDTLTRRPMIEYSTLTINGSKPLEHRFAGGKSVRLNPVRFVAACKDGHLSDIDWRRVVHQRSDNKSCTRALHWTERGVSSDPSDIAVQCDCGARVALAELHAEGFLGTCTALSPWLNPRKTPGETCAENFKLLARSATNAYFPQTVSIISLPKTSDALSEAISNHWSMVQPFLDMEGRNGILQKLPQLRQDLDGRSDEEIDAAIRRVQSGLASDTPSDPRIEEFDRLGARAGPIGSDGADSRLFGERLDHEVIESCDLSHRLLDEIVQIHRLREVACLYGFTRLEPAPTALESELDDISLATTGAPLSREADWLPAAERFGEGIFLRFDPTAIAAWEERIGKTGRLDGLRLGEVLEDRKFGRPPEHKGAAYWALHSLSHALMSELALECGYPLSSLKERVYASMAGADARYGILIYTATAGGQGTLGGLSRTADRIPAILDRVREALRLCSNDPVCEDHHPDGSHDDRNLLGAACHSCLLVSETSCEARNGRLDRKLLVRDEDDAGLLSWSS